MATEIETEKRRRQAMWSGLVTEGGPNRVQPSLLRKLRIYGGAQGIWVDQEVTSSVAEQGVTVGLLHTGLHYPDELDEDGVIYHYPNTKRTGRRDEGEIAATKAACTNKIPVFVITRPGPTSAIRNVYLAWVEGWDDNERWFLVTFGDAPPSEPIDPVTDQIPFQLLEERPRRPVEGRSRPGQHRFKFQVLRRYGATCAMCDLNVRELLEAAHIVPDEKNGSNDPRNGLVLCRNHHVALDRGLLAIHPESLEFHIRRDGPDKGLLGVTRNDLTHLERRPHLDALRWRWERWSELEN